MAIFQYKAIAAGLTPPTQAFINGGFRAALSGDTFDTVNPATGDIIAQVAACGTSDVDFAVEKAREAFDQGPAAYGFYFMMLSAMFMLTNFISGPITRRIQARFTAHALARMRAGIRPPPSAP